MVIILNKCYGGFHIPEALCEAEGLSRYDDIERTDARLVNFILEHGVVEEGCAKLVPVAIPDEATDWELDEYDGFESVTYVVGGKLYHA